MKYFLIEITYSVPLEEVDKVLAEHRAFLQTGYDSGMLLCSGRMNPITGGIVIARANEQSEIEQFVSNDPFHLHKVATHRVVEFNPVKFNRFFEQWMKA